VPLRWPRCLRISQGVPDVWAENRASGPPCWVSSSRTAQGCIARNVGGYPISFKLILDPYSLVLRAYHKSGKASVTDCSRLAILKASQPIRPPIYRGVLHTAQRRQVW